MIYKFDKKELVFKDITIKYIGYSVLFFLIVSFLFSLFFVFRLENIKSITEETKVLILKDIQKNEEFSERALKDYIFELNLPYPDIVFAQAKLESGNFNSEIFKTNNNLFGMKVAKIRPSTNKGEQNNHAVYKNWKESVLDYALFYSFYLKDIDSEEEYFIYLQNNYSESSNYVEILKQIIKNEK